jgi:hypothetical protein
VRLAQAGDAAGVRQILDEVRADSAEWAGSFASLLAYAGDAEGAMGLWPALERRPAERELLGALVTWRSAGAAEALPALRRLARGDPRAPADVPPEAPAWFAAECALQAEGGEAALADLHRFQRFHFPLGFWRAWAYPRSLVLEARLLDGLGRRDEARAALDRFGRLWRRADPDQPLLEEARSLRRELGHGWRQSGESAGRRQR